MISLVMGEWIVVFFVVIDVDFDCVVVVVNWV